MIDKYVKKTYKVDLELVEKSLMRLPFHIIQKFRHWVRSIERNGLLNTQKQISYRDKPLDGKRKGQRSARLNRSYRIFYKVSEKNKEVVVLEVNKHEY